MKRLVAMLGGLGLVGPAVAAVSLDLAAPHGLQGTVIEASLNVTADSPMAGFNAEIVLPEGVSVASVTPGGLLNPDFGFSFAVSGQIVRIIGWSPQITFTGTGEILKLGLLIGTAPVGLKSLSFASSNPEPLINSQHAVSNFDGSVSLAHDVTDASFLVYSEMSDFDGDGFSDLLEILDGSDPTDPLSIPNTIFKDGFEPETGP